MQGQGQQDIESGRYDSAPLLGSDRWDRFLPRLPGRTSIWNFFGGSGRRTEAGVAAEGAAAAGSGPTGPSAVQEQPSGGSTPEIQAAPAEAAEEAGAASAQGPLGGAGEGAGVRPKGASPRAEEPSLGAVVRRYFTRSSSTGGLRPKDSGVQPTCLICLENLSPEDFESGEAFSLDCQCRGEMALRHRTCAEKWARVKGDRLCDVCKAPVRNLPDFTPRAHSDAGSEASGLEGERLPGSAALGYGELPGSADIIFDCIRVTWVAMIILILFFECSLLSSLVGGLLVGVGYTLFARAMYRSQLAALQRERAGGGGGGQAAGEGRGATQPPSSEPSEHGGSAGSSPRAAPGPVVPAAAQSPSPAVPAVAAP